MARPKLKDPICKAVTFKVTKKDFNKLKGLAKLWTNGDLSEFIRLRVFDGKIFGAKK